MNRAMKRRRRRMAFTSVFLAGWFARQCLVGPWSVREYALARQVQQLQDDAAAGRLAEAMSSLRRS